MEYTPLASGGIEKSTLKGKNVAMKHFETFCSTKGLGLNSTGVASAQRLSEEELCSEQLFREFETCLVFVSGAAAQYLYSYPNHNLYSYFI